jgi:cytochrome b561
VDPKLVTPIVIAALVIFAIYRRLRRSFGRQTVNVARIWFRIGILIFVGVLIAAGAVHNDPATLGALLGGLVCGAGLAYLGVRHTQFEVTPQGRFYTPHTYIGIFVTVVFLGRLLYRLQSLYPNLQAASPGQGWADAYQRSPLTLAIFGMLISYYVLFYLGVLQKTRVPLVPDTDSPKT